MLLLTGATGTIGAPLLARLTAQGTPVRCLIRDPRHLGDQRVRVQIALGDLADHLSFRHALRGVDTVVHLAASRRDQPGYSIEELNAVATWRLVRAAERAGVKRFIFLSGLGASALSPSRLKRAKAAAERAVTAAALSHTILAPGFVYAPGDRLTAVLSELSLLGVLPLPGDGRARFQPITVGDVVSCLVAVLADPEATAERRYELAGPDTLEFRQIAERLAAAGRGVHRPALSVPTALVRRGLQAAELVLGPTTPVTWEEAELLTLSALSDRGTADAEALGTTPQPITPAAK